jgi:hypothetical protein
MTPWIHFLHLAQMRSVSRSWRISLSIANFDLHVSHSYDHK